MFHTQEDTMMMIAIAVRVLVLSAVLLAGCSATDPVLLRHPQTGKTVRCGPYSYHQGIGSLEGAIQLERGCVSDFQRQGYERVME